MKNQINTTTTTTNSDRDQMTATALKAASDLASAMFAQLQKNEARMADAARRAVDAGGHFSVQFSFREKSASIDLLLTAPAGDTHIIGTVPVSFPRPTFN